MTTSLGDEVRETAIKQFQGYKQIAERALAQVDDTQFFAQARPDVNSIATLVKHMAGNLHSRWTAFLTTDGEKIWRRRDAEFVNEGESRDALMAAWESGWTTLFAALTELTPVDLQREVTVRGRPQTAFWAVTRQLAHYGYHIGQIVLLAQQHLGDAWRPLTVPRGASAAHNARMGYEPREDGTSPPVPPPA